MCKKYRLIKEYPFSEKLGCIARYDGNNLYRLGYEDKDRLIREFGGQSGNTIEPFPEFWELIKEPEFQVLAAKTSVKISLTAENTSTEIYKILRLFDNEIFSIGNKIEHSYTYGNDIITKTYTIEKIYTLDDGSVRFYVDGGLNLGLEKLKKYSPKALFVTEDKVEVFHGDRLWLVNTNFEYYSFYSDCQNVGKRIFSTEKAAKDWIDLNRPKYSLQDIRNAIIDYKGCYHKVIDMNKLKK